MIGAKKLSTIRKELRAAFAREKKNPIASLDRKIRELCKNKPATKESRSLLLLRDALAQVVEVKVPRRRRRQPANRAKKAL
ncbi:MAG: hypothetical protein L0215_05565 [Gemmataceae bacterium]|nr:hypothetical protein [Gemmataceae bacterium]